jgi:hypothetical protein
MWKYIPRIKNSMGKEKRGLRQSVVHLRKCNEISLQELTVYVGGMARDEMVRETEALH